ncbi:MAG: hypothetical protein ACREUE_06470, partial [Panacagrimonas sp.]
GIPGKFGARQVNQRNSNGSKSIIAPAMDSDEERYRFLAHELKRRLAVVMGCLGLCAAIAALYLCLPDAHFRIALFAGVCGSVLVWLWRALFKSP